jgi:uracil phosphoribosyltransferase
MNIDKYTPFLTEDSFLQFALQVSNTLEVSDKLAKSISKYTNDKEFVNYIEKLIKRIMYESEEKKKEKINLLTQEPKYKEKIILIK